MNMNGTYSTLHTLFLIKILMVLQAAQIIFVQVRADMLHVIFK